MDTREDAHIHKTIACKYLSNNICTVVKEWHHGYLCLGNFSSSTHYDLVKCAEVGLVRQVHTLFVRSAQVVHELQVREEVEGMRQEVREVKGESKVVESRSLHEHMWMTWMTNTRLMT